MSNKTVPIISIFHVIKKALTRSAQKHEIRKMGLLGARRASGRNVVLEAMAAPTLRIARVIYRLVKDKDEDWHRTVRLAAFRQKYPIGPEEWAIVCPFHIGDVYLYSTLAKSLLSYHGGSSVKFFTKPQHAFIPKLFPSIKEVITVEPPFSLDEIGFRDMTLLGNSGDSPLKGTYCKPAWGAVALFVGYKSVNFLDCFRVNLGLPCDAELERPRAPSSEEMERARQLFLDHHLDEDKGILICPDAQTSANMRQIPDGFWEELAAELKQRGFQPITNLGPTTKLISGTQGVKIPLELVRPAAMLLGGVIANRSGLCDLIADLPVKLTVLYPPGRLGGGSMLDGASLKAMGLSTTAVEMTVDVDHLDSTLNAVLESYPVEAEKAGGLPVVSP